MRQEQSSTKVAGIDVGKRRLDVAIYGSPEMLELANEAAAIAGLVDWLKARGVTRVGMEASGGYERLVRSMLEQAGFEVVVHQPLEVRLFARLKRRRAKNDRLDAQVIAAATAQMDRLRAAQDPRLQELAERLTAYEQISEALARLKTCMEHVTVKEVAEDFVAQMRSLRLLKLKLAAAVVSRIKDFPDLAQRYQLVRSLPGAGQIVAAALVIRMPELGAMKRGQAASLLGVAPFDRDSGQFKGERHIWGGRQRPRRLLYLAAVCAKRCDPGFRAFAQRLESLGKKPKVITVAVMRKLIEAANLVLARQQPWVVRPA